MTEVIEDSFSLEIKYKGNSLSLNGLKFSDTLGYLKSLICEQTSVPPKNQKLLGLKSISGVTLDDSLTFKDIIIPSNYKLILMGSTQDQIKGVTAAIENNNEVVDDLDCNEISENVAHRVEYIAKVERRVKEYKVTLIDNPRSQSKLLVLDIDYTIFDHRSTAQSVRDLMRPYLHEFLSKVYSAYDIAIWSATGMGWIRTKLCEMGLISREVSQSISYSAVNESDNGDPANTFESQDLFKISLILDQGAMISVHFPDEGVKEVKPLRVIWENYPQWGPHNTIMFDDIQRNFVMNPQSGLKIKPYKHSARTRETDRELLDLADYLLMISVKKDFSKLNHKHWRRYLTESESNNSSKKPKMEK